VVVTLAIAFEKRRSRSPARRSHSRESSRSRSPRSRSRSGERYRSYRRDQTPDRSSRRKDDFDRDSETFVKMVASVVKERSPEFESKLKLWEADSPKYAFLADEQVCCPSLDTPRSDESR
jgi:hypothetical protein